MVAGEKAWAPVKMGVGDERVKRRGKKKDNAGMRRAQSKQSRENRNTG
jgi:hypothetical protein